mmetsp:Transcript_69388/g.110207  ORF Transcript_69388/g.110207 Transcript_69388/m.110207 type:complete len:145 (+) Transcript_69388:51-485(+)
MPLENPLSVSTYMNKGVLIGIGGSYLVAVMYFGPFAATHTKESGYTEQPQLALKQTAFLQEIATWTVQSMAMYYLVKQMEIQDPLKATIAVGGVVGIFFSALPHYMRWKWVQEKSNKSSTAIMIDCGGHILFNMVQAFCVAKYG